MKARSCSTSMMLTMRESGRRKGNCPIYSTRSASDMLHCSLQCSNSVPPVIISNSRSRALHKQCVHNFTTRGNWRLRDASRVCVRKRFMEEYHLSLSPTVCLVPYPKQYIQNSINRGNWCLRDVSQVCARNVFTED